MQCSPGKNRSELFLELVMKQFCLLIYTIPTDIHCSLFVLNCDLCVHSICTHVRMLGGCTHLELSVILNYNY